MIKAVAIIAPLLVLAVAVPAQARLTFVCRGGPPQEHTLPSGPERGAPMGINAKRDMACRQVHRAVARGFYTRAGPRLRFQTRGFRCRIVQLFFQFKAVVGEQLACSAASRSFEFDWGP